MTTTTAIKAARTLITAGTSNSAGGATRGTLDMRTVAGGLLTAKITNGATGPTQGATVYVMVAHDTGTTPAAGAAGATWKTIGKWMAGTANSVVYEMPGRDLSNSIMHLQVEVSGNTGQAVTCEAYVSEVSSYSTT